MTNDRSRPGLAVHDLPGPEDIERGPATERANRMPALGVSALDPKKTIGLAAAAGAIMFTVLALGTGLSGNQSLPPAKPRPALEPSRYDPQSVIAPTLAQAPSDPNAPIPIDATQVPAIQPETASAASGQPAGVAQDPAATVREAARRSPLLAIGGERDSGESRIASLPSQQAESTPSSDGSRREPTALEALRRGSAIGRVTALPLPDRNFLIAAGAFIPCILQTAMDSSQPGLVSCVVPRPIYSDNGHVVLLEKGTKVLGEYQGGLSRGQYRLFVVWTRATTPQGVAIELASPMTDPLGRAGADGRVESFFWRRFGAALLFSLIDDGATVAAGAVGDRRTNVTRVPSNAASTILEQNGEIKPVLRKNQGEDVGISVAQDLDFSSVYGLRLK